MSIDLRPSNHSIQIICSLNIELKITKAYKRSNFRLS